jgi:hypothetical protein
LFNNGPPPGEHYVAEIVIIIDTLGRVDPCSTRIVQDYPPGSAEKLVRRVVQWQFASAEREGRKVRAVTTVKVEAPGG